MATWVQATDDNLPEHDKSVPLLVNGDYDFGWCDHSVKRFYTHSEGEQPFRNVKWLSESTPGNPEIDSCIEALQEFYEKTQHPDYESVDEVTLLDAIQLLKKLRHQSIPSSIVRRLEEMNPYKKVETTYDEDRWSEGWTECVSNLTELLSAQPAEQGEENFYLYDEITNQLEGIASVEDAKTFIRENYIEGNSIHPDFSAFLILKEVGTVETIEENDEVKGIQIKLSNHNQQS